MCICFHLPTSAAAIFVSSTTKGIESLIDISLQVQSLGRLSSPWSQLTIIERHLSTSIVFQGPIKQDFKFIISDVHLLCHCYDTDIVEHRKILN